MASSDSQDLTPLDTNQINVVLRLKEENKMKQTQIRWLEAELQSEKRKVEKKEKEVLETELKLHASTKKCEDLANKQSMLEAQLSNKDKEIASLTLSLTKIRNERDKLIEANRSIREMQLLEKSFPVKTKKDTSLLSRRENDAKVSESESDKGEIKELDDKLKASEADYANLIIKFDTLVASENSLKSLSDKLEREKAQLQNNLKEEKCKSQQLELNTQSLESDLKKLQIGLGDKVLEFHRLEDETKLAKENYEPCLNCQFVELAMDSRNLERLKKEFQEKTISLKEKSGQLNTKANIQETELAALREERDHLRQDVDSSKWAKDEVVKNAWTMREVAVARKNYLEMVLTMTNIELMDVNNQLLEAVQQKIDLSQQLDQWQLDMQALLDEKMRKKLKIYEETEETRPSGQGQ